MSDHVPEGTATVVGDEGTHAVLADGDGPYFALWAAWSGTRPG